MDDPHGSPKHVPALPGIIVTLILLTVAILFRVFGKPGAITLTLPDHASNYTIIAVSQDYSLTLDRHPPVYLAGVLFPADKNPSPVKETVMQYFLTEVKGKTCHIEPDPLITNSDPAHPKYYVYIDKTFLNLEMIRKGIAITETEASFVFRDDFLNAEKSAWMSKAGLWKEYSSHLLLMRFESLSPEKQKDVYSAMAGKTAATDKPPSVQPGKTAQWEDAHLYYGRQVTFEGKIVQTKNTGKVCYLNFHPNYKKFLSLVIFASDLPKFPMNPEKFYLNKTVKVTGIVKEYQGRPEIILNSPSQITIIVK
jgi:hypothetical protein